MSPKEVPRYLSRRVRIFAVKYITFVSLTLFVVVVVDQGLKMYKDSFKKLES